MTEGEAAALRKVGIRSFRALVRESRAVSIFAPADMSMVERHTSAPDPGGGGWVRDDELTVVAVTSAEQLGRDVLAAFARGRNEAGLGGG